jgi:hypothetical protein
VSPFPVIILSLANVITSQLIIIFGCLFRFVPIIVLKHGHLKALRTSTAPQRCGARPREDSFNRMIISQRDQKRRGNRMDHPHQWDHSNAKVGNLGLFVVGAGIDKLMRQWSLPCPSVACSFVEILPTQGRALNILRGQSPSRLAWLG